MSRLDEAALKDSMAELIKEIAETLRSGIENQTGEHRFRRAPIAHGAQRVKVGFEQKARFVKPTAFALPMRD